MFKKCAFCDERIIEKFECRVFVKKFCSRKCYEKSKLGKKRPSHSILMSGSGNSRWRGGRRFDKDGYVIVHNPNHPFCCSDGYVREHRLVMEFLLGRYLSKDEVVHHKNHIRNDNRLENLELLRKKDHDRLHLSEIRKKKLKPEQGIAKLEVL